MSVKNFIPKFHEEIIRNNIVSWIRKIKSFEEFPVILRMSQNDKRQNSEEHSNRGTIKNLFNFTKLSNHTTFRFRERIARLNRKSRMSTLLLFIIDESLSMRARKQQIVDGINQFLDVQRQIEGPDARLILIKFNSVVTFLHKGKFSLSNGCFGILTKPSFFTLSRNKIVGCWAVKIVGVQSRR